MNMKTHTCLVCGYNELERPAADHLICPSCGTQFGLDDRRYSIDELRAAWIKNGSPWFDYGMTNMLRLTNIKTMSDLFKAIGFIGRDFSDEDIKAQTIIISTTNAVWYLPYETRRVNLVIEEIEYDAKLKAFVIITGQEYKS